jgi:carboxypeptidase Taq
MPKKTATAKDPRPATGPSCATKSVPANTKSQSGAIEKRLAALKQRLAEVADLEAASAVLSWDQATFMPRGGVVARGHQLATLDRLAHAILTDPETGRLLDSLQKVIEARGLDDLDAALIRVTRRDYDHARKIPEALVTRISRHTNAAYAAWTDARPANDFAAVLPHLENGVTLARDLSKALGGGAHVMDPLIDRSEPGMTVQAITQLFDELRAPLVALVNLAKSTQSGEDACLLQHYPETEQLALGLRFAEHFGYDLTRGRQDISPHPFCTTFANGDVRITTRVKSVDLSGALYSTLHEAGHAIYEQGVAPALDRTRLQGGASPGVHESQSRLWENIVGRSEGFLSHAYPLLQKQFPKQLKRVPVKTFYRGINRVAPSLIRTDADELTYNLHVMIRFDLECRLLDGRLKAKDIPAAWAELYARDLGVTVPSHADGCLQDVHWFGYPIGGAFQGYTIGNILSAQFYAAAVAKHPAIPDEIAAGKFATLHGWLRENIYRHGRMYDPADLVQRATGGPMSTAPYIAYLSQKYEALVEMRRIS